jgi:hypothetical protein
MLIVSLDCSFLICFSFVFLRSCLVLNDKRKTKSRMNNPETQSTLSTRQERRNTKEKQNQE